MPGARGPLRLALAGAFGGLLAVPAGAAPASAPARSIEVHGHRGARALRPENTLPAFEHALAVGADVLELDLVVTYDDALVVLHDPVVDPERCTGRRGERLRAPFVVRQHTLAALKLLDCGGLPNPRFPRQEPQPGTPVPTFGEVLAHVAASSHPGAAKVRFNVEAKTVPGRPELSPPPERFAALIVAELKARGALERAILQSFDHRLLVEAKKLEPKLRTAALVGKTHPVDLVAVARSAHADLLSPHHEWITKDDVDALHAAGVQVVPWTANAPEEWDRLIALGVDGIITDDPAALIAHLKAKGLR